MAANMSHKSKDRFFLPKTMNRASSKDRFVAYVIDMVVVSILSSLVVGAISFHASAVSLILNCLYFILGHKLYGVTVGKQAMGIFVASQESTGLTWKQTILREVFWKWVSAMLFMYGYIRILFFQEALHDKWGKTVVLSEKKADANFMKAALVTAIFIGLCVCSGYYAVTQTSLMGHVVAKSLIRQGHVIRGISGNPKKGWSIAYWKGQSEKGIYELNDIRFSYDFSKLYSTGILNIKEVNVSKAVYRVNDAVSFLNKNKSAIDKPEKSDKKPYDQQRLLSKLLVGKINLGHLKIIRKNEIDIDINRFYISNLSVDKNQASFDQFYVDAPVVQFQAWNSSYDFATKVIDLKSNFQLRNGLHPSILKTVDGSIEYRGSLQNPNLVKAEFFGRRMRVGYAASNFYFKVNNFTPSQYLKYDKFVRNFSAVIQNRFCEGITCFTGGQARGQFVHNNKKFVFEGSSVWQPEIPNSRMKLQITSLLMNTLNTSPLFLVHTEDLRNYISDIYFAKNYEMLSLEEKMNIDAVSKHYYKYTDRSTSSEKGALPSRDDFNR
jgi:uncharacterized RDD family membrane protein YckC